jgi:cell division protein FtsB
MAKVKGVDFSRRGKWLNLLFLGFFVYLGTILVRQQFVLRALERQQTDLQQQVQEAERKNQHLKERAQGLTEDLWLIEVYIRQQLGMIREGETVYILPRRNNSR